MNNVVKISKRKPIKLDKARAINQASQVFKNLPSVVWEYVTNGLAYMDVGTSPEVIVQMEKDSITFADNGRGMNEDDLDNFFTAHGENKDIKEATNIPKRLGIQFSVNNITRFPNETGKLALETIE